MGEITLRKAIDDYKTVYMAYRNFAERTRIEYQNDLEALIAFLEKSGVKHVKAFGLPNIERYVAHLEQEGFASLTRKRKVVGNHSFLSFLHQEGYIDANLSKRIVLPFTESTTPNVLTQTECNKIRNACADNPRDAAIIELLLQTGLKLSELAHLTLNDIQLDEKDGGFMRVLGSRGKKQRLIPLNDKACAALKNYFGVRKDLGNPVLFLNRFDEPMSESGIQKMLRKYLKRSGVKRASIQTLRHTFGFMHLAKGTSLKTVQDVMGLKDGRSVTPYLLVARALQKHSL